MQEKHRAIAVILAEHRALNAVLHGLRFMVRRIGEEGAEPDFRALRAMLHYIDTFPEQKHHPKETRYLFRGIRRRTHEADAMLADLEGEHIHGAEMIRHLEQGLLRYEEGGAEYFPAFSTSIEAYCDFHWQHMRKEEDLILPLAGRVLTPQDWDELDSAFAENLDPFGSVGVHEDFEKLFERIVALAPPPIGVGPG
jgi:hemerythrin-like domain-containing protein